jgi:hypothetical protein
LPIDIVDGWVRDRLQCLAFDTKTIERVRERASELLGERNHADSVRFAQLTSERQNLEKALARVEDRMFLDGKNDDRLSESYDRYSERLEMVKSSLKILEGDSIKTLELLDKLIALAMSLGTVYDALDEVKKQKLIRLLIHKIFVDPQGISSIDYQLPLVDKEGSSGKASKPTIEPTRINILAIRIINFTIKHLKSIESLADFVY